MLKGLHAVVKSMDFFPKVIEVAGISIEIQRQTKQMKKSKCSSLREKKFIKGY